MGSAKKMLAWITLLTQPSYLDGVRTLNRSLQNTRSRYPLVVMAELFVLVMWAWSWFTLGRNPRAMLLVLAIAHVVAVGMAYKGIGIIIIT